MKNLLKQCGKALCYLLLFVGSQNLIAFILEIIYSVKAAMDAAMTGSAPPDQQTLMDGMISYIYDHSTTIIVFSGCLTLLILWVFFLIRKKKLFVEANISQFSGKYIPLLIVLGIALQIFISFSMSFLPETILEDYAADFNLKFGIVSIIAVLAEVIIAPIVEEIIFRGLILSRLRKVMPTAAAVLISAAAFGLVHGQILWMAYTFILGIVFAAIAIRTDSILASIILHAVFNGTGVILSLFDAEFPMALYICITVASCVICCGSLYFLLRKQSETDSQLLN